MTRRVAAIDCGTNSVRLLVADVDEANNVLAEVTRQMRIVRLGEGLDRTGTISPEALHRTFAALDDFAADVSRYRVEQVRFVATSATRDAANRDEFISGVRQRIGVTPEVVSGVQEAALSFTGATHDLANQDIQVPYLVVDIGGGSTEIVMGDQGGISTSASIDVGCVRMTERYFRNDPPLPSEVAKARTEIDDAIRRAAETMPLRTAGTLVGLAGSVTTVAALALGLWEYDRDRIHHARISAADVHRVCEELLYADHDKRSGNPAIHPGRVDVIAAGSLVLSAVVAYTGVRDVLVSEHDILDGIALSHE